MQADVIRSAVVASALALSSLVPQQMPALGPAPQSLEELWRWQEVDKIIERYWSGLDGFATSANDEKAISQASGEFGSTYGECTKEGARAIFAALGLYEARGARFADLGSGVGKLAAQAYLECPLAGALGVELSETRHARALRAWKLVEASGDWCRDGAEEGLLPSPYDGLRFECGDVFEADLAGFTHVFVANLCFSPDTDVPLARRLAASESVVRVAALRPLKDEARLQQLGKIRARTTWHPAGADVYVYGRR